MRGGRGAVGAGQDVPPHEEVAVVAEGASVVGAVVRGGAEADGSEGGVPGVVDLPTKGLHKRRLCAIATFTMGKQLTSQWRSASHEERVAPKAM